MVLVEPFVRRNCQTVLIDVDPHRLAVVAGEFSRLGRSITQHCADVSCESAMKQVAEAVLRSHGQVHLLINNAGISISSPFQRTDSAAFEHVIRVNFFGVVNTCRAFLCISGLSKGAPTF